MKTNNIFYTIAFALATLVFQPCSAQRTSQKKIEKKALITRLINSRQFTFVPQSMSPLRGGFRNITSYYDVRISKDTLRSYLPYFGRAFTASIGATDGPMDFTSLNFEYSVSPAKKHGWNISVKPKDKPGIQSFYFTIFDNGSAVLEVTSISRDAISYNGYIMKNDTKK